MHIWFTYILTKMTPDAFIVQIVQIVQIVLIVLIVLIMPIVLTKLLSFCNSI